MTDTDNTTLSALLARQVLAALVRNGVTRIAYSPGSRNAPFAYAVADLQAQGTVKVQPFTDERSAGFWALGAVRASGQPAAIITTSGTAAAEVHPAVEEARNQGLPIVVITADRPAEMRGVGASQTTHQEGMYARSVLEWDSLGPGDGTRPQQVSDRVRRLLARARGWWGEPGPVHLNVAFRDPLTPGSQWDVPAMEPGEDAPSIPERSGPDWDQAIRSDLRTIVIAGDRADRAVGQAAARRGIPLLAEPTSGLVDLSTWIPFTPTLVSNLAGYVQQVIVTGHPTLSRAVTALLADPEVRVTVVAQRAEWVDVAGNAEEVVAALNDIDTPQLADENWLQLWRRASVVVESVLVAEADAQLNLLSACRRIGEVSSMPLWLGASNTIRAFDIGQFVPLQAPAYANRGLAGIDGTIASAWGAAAAQERPVRAVIGDMTFAVDLSTLTQTPAEHAGDAGGPALDLQVFVLDDGGAGIFASLEHGAADPGTYEKFFAVPPHVDIVAAARACGWDAHEAGTLEELEKVLSQPVRGRSVVRVPIPRPGDLLRQISADTAVALTNDQQFQETLSCISGGSAKTDRQ